MFVLFIFSISEIVLISFYIVISSHELLPFDFHDLKEFLIEEPSVNEDDRSCIDLNEVKESQKALPENSTSSCITSHAKFDDFHIEQTRSDFKYEQYLDLSPIRSKRSQKQRGIKKEKERRLTAADEFFGSDLFFAGENGKLTTETEKNQEITTPKSCTLDGFTKAFTCFDDADFVVANEDEQKIESINLANQAQNRWKINKPYKTVNADSMMKIWEIKDNSRSNTINEDLCFSSGHPNLIDN